MIEGVISDWDGTLADTQKIIAQSFAAALAEIGCYVDSSLIAKHFGTGTRKTLQEALKSQGCSFDDALIARLSARKNELQVAQRDEVRLFPGAVELLDVLRGRKSLALASMSVRHVLEGLLSHLRLNDRFNTIVTADDVERPKPHPDIFLAAADRLGKRPYQCAVIEDSVHGVEAAKAAQMKVIAVTTGNASMQELAGLRPDLIVQSLQERDRILQCLSL